MVRSYPVWYIIEEAYYLDKVREKDIWSLAMAMQSVIFSTKDKSANKSFAERIKTLFWG